MHWYSHRPANLYLFQDDTLNPRTVLDINAVVEANQHRMSMDPFESILANMGFRMPGVNIEPAIQDLPSCRTC